MNASDILKYGHLTVLKTLEGVPDSEWEKSGVCGWWSVKNIIAHLDSYEQVLIDVLSSFGQTRSTTLLDEFIEGRRFNDRQVEARLGRTPAQTLAEFNEAHTRTLSLVAQISTESLRQPGTLPWYGAEYALDDFIVYSYYGHKREHSAQIAVFIDTLKATPESRS